MKGVSFLLKKVLDKGQSLLVLNVSYKPPPPAAPVSSHPSGISTSIIHTPHTLWK